MVELEPFPGVPAAERALVVVDVEGDFCDDFPGAGLPVAGGGAVARATNAYLKAHGDDYALVVATADWHVEPGEHFASIAGLPVDPAAGHWPDHCRAGTPGAAWHPDLLAGIDPGTLGGEGLVVVHKGEYAAAYSGFEGHVEGSTTTLEELLRARGITAVDYVGIATGHCVAATARDSLAHGFRTRVLAPLTAAVEPAHGAAELAALAAAGAEVVGEPVAA